MIAPVQVDDVMCQRGQARNLAQRFKRVDAEDEERCRRPREMIVIERAEGPSVLENEPAPCRPDVVRSDLAAELVDIAAVERGTTRNLVASWKNKELEQPSRQARTSCCLNFIFLTHVLMFELFMYVYSCNALSARFFAVDRALNSCFMIMIMIMLVRYTVG